MEAWWEGISTLNKVFVCSSVVFTVLFVWQLFMTHWGADTHDMGHLGDASPSLGPGASIHLDTHEFSGSAFSLISLRSILAFGTLFSVAGSLYLAGGVPVLVTLVYSFLWGMLAMVGVSFILHVLLKMQEQGNVSVAWAIGEKGTVYINIPAAGSGKVRLMVRGVMSIVNARSADGIPIGAGAKIEVTNVVDGNTVEVVQLWNSQGE